MVTKAWDFRLIYWNRYAYLVLGVLGGRNSRMDTYHSISPEWVIVHTI